MTKQTSAQQIVDVEQLQPDERTATAATDLQKREHRLTFVYLVLFGLVTSVLIYVWLDRTAGERTCKKWMESGEPRLEAIAIKMNSQWQPGEMTCDNEEAIRYFEDCLAAAGPWTQALGSYFYNDCTILLRFENGTEYRVPGPCRITAEGLDFSLPGRKRLTRDVGSTSLAFQDPMPDSWKHALNTLLGAGTVE